MWPLNIFVLSVVILSTAITISGAEPFEITTESPTSSPSEPTSTKEPSTVTPSQPTTGPTTVPSTATTSVMPTTPPPTVTTTAKPTTIPPHKDDMWIITDPTSKRVCLVADLMIQLDLPYTNSTSNKVIMGHVKVPGDAKGTGSCNISDSSSPQKLLLQWGPENSTSVVTLTFASNATSKQFWLNSIKADVVADNKTFPGISNSTIKLMLVNETRHFVTPLGNSYSCSAKLNIPGQLTPDVNQTGYFTLDSFQLQAFMNSTSNGFSSPIYCEGDNTPDLVPVLVGCTLVGLVIIVLAVYLWGRRRSQQRGYLSM